MDSQPAVQKIQKTISEVLTRTSVEWCSPRRQLMECAMTGQRRFDSDVSHISRCTLNLQLISQKRRWESNPLLAALQAAA